MTNEITVEQKEKIVEETNGLVAQANGLIIRTEQENTSAANMTAAFKAEIKKRKKSDLYLKSEESKKAATASFKALTEMLIDPLEEAVDIISEKIGVFYKAETARRAELQRIEDEKVAAALKKEEERVARLTAKAEEQGKPTPVIIPKVIPQRVVAAVSAPSGTTYSTRYSAKVVDIKALCLAVANGTVPEHYVTAVMSTLNSLAMAKKAEGEIAPGVVSVGTIITTQR